MKIPVIERFCDEVANLTPTCGLSISSEHDVVVASCRRIFNPHCGDLRRQDATTASKRQNACAAGLFGCLSTGIARSCEVADELSSPRCFGILKAGEWDC
jgi:hypothetical protein